VWALGLGRDAGEPRTAASADGRAEAPLVLVAEDNPDMRRFVAESLAPECRVVTAEDGEQALEEALALLPDLILTDVMMPRASGDRLVRDVRSRPELDRVPLVVLTAKADEDLRVELLRAGAQDYLQKPFSVRELKARVGNLLALKRTRDVLERETATRSEDLAALAAELVSRTREIEAARAEAEAASRAKDEFLATLSHELRTPLQSILGWAGMLRGELDRETRTRALETLERNARALADLVRDLLDVARIVRGELRLEAQPVDPVAMVEAALEAVRPLAEAKSIRLEAALDPAVGAVRGDPSRLQQVVWNLLSNGVKFTPGGGRVQVRLEPRGSELEIRVSDDGEGIRPEFLPHLFERFRQADGTTTREHGGLGLGLAIVRHLVELHGGTVRAESAGEGRGATFIVTLPRRAAGPGAGPPGAVERSADTPKAVPPARAQLHAPSLDGVRVAPGGP
jgi:signal transduction histidine kinase